jgi:serine protease
VLVKTNTAGLTTQAAREDVATQVALDYGLTSIKVGTEQLPGKFTIAAGQSLEAVIAQLNADPRVAYAEPNYYIYPLSLSGDAQFFKQWALPYAGIPVAWDVRDSSDDIVVAVLDTGIDLDHPDLAGVFLPGRDFCAGKNGADCTTDNDPRPELTGDQHGTHVTGIIAANGNSRGVAGVVKGNVKILPIKVFFQGGFTTADALASAIVYASQNANILNLSLGTEAESQTLLDAVNTATGNGALIIAAAGNFGKTSLLAPARYAATNNQVAAIGSVNSNFRRSCFSHTGQGLTLMAVGGDFDLASAGFSVTCASGTRPEAILSTIPGSYGLLFGTSQATPLVTGVAALVWAENPGFSASQVLDKLKSSAYFDASFMTTNAYGAGIVRADQALGVAGPGDDLSITAEGDANADSAVDTVTLELDGSSTAFDLSGLKADRYTLMADGKRLSGSSSVSVSVAQSKNNVRLKAKAQ